jgi:hypothetical protein
MIINHVVFKGFEGTTNTMKNERENPDSPYFSNGKAPSVSKEDTWPGKPTPQRYEGWGWWKKKNNDTSCQIEKWRIDDGK